MESDEPAQKWDNGINIHPATPPDTLVDFTKPIFSVEFYFDDSVQFVMINAELGESQAIEKSVEVIRARGLIPLNAREIIVTELEVFPNGVKGSNSSRNGEEAGGSGPE